MDRTSQPPSPPDESDRSTADEQIRPTGSSQARSYECIFCKRGFSTAQALGGHMNIHRKDKAKLKQLAATSDTSPNPNTEAQLSLNQSVDIPRSPSLFYSPNINLPSSQTHESLYSMSTKIDNPDKGKFSTWPRFRRGDSPAGFDVDHRKGRELPVVFFEDQIPASKEQELDDDPFPLPDDEDKGDDHPPPIHGDPGSAEIDLELRLGPERPQASSSPSKGTKQFF